MLAGGLAALTLQTLHPLALAGVWDHSNFRGDLVGRLRRTTAFVGGTTYAPRAQAEALIAHVRRIHTHVTGVAEDGRPYAANDPHLLTWVHVTEAYSFLQGYRRYSHVAIPPGAPIATTTKCGESLKRLAPRRCPRSEQQVSDYFRRIQPELAFTERSRVVLDLALAGTPAGARGRAVARRVPAGRRRAAAGLGNDHAAPDAVATRSGADGGPGIGTVAPVFRTALADGIASRACRRMDLPPEKLQQWE